MSLRDEFLRLLREDEEFRYAVMGLLGVADLRSDLKRLADALDKVLEVVRGLAEAEARHMDLTGQVFEITKQLAEGQRQVLEVVKGLAEGQARLMDAVRQLAEGQVRLMEGQARLMDAIKELAEGQRELAENQRGLMNMTRQVLETVQKLADVEARHLEITQRILEEIRALKEGQEELRKGQEELRVGLDNLSRKVDGLSRSYGGLSRNMGLLIEQNVRHYLPAWVREVLGVNVDRLRRRVIEGVGEFDGYAEAGNKVVVAEVKETLRLRDVESFLEKINKLRQTMASKEVIAIIAHVFRGRDYTKAIELAKANNVKVVRHIGEEDFEEIV